MNYRTVVPRSKFPKTIDSINPSTVLFKRTELDKCVKFTQLPNTVLRDRELSVQALGILAYLISFHEDVAVNARMIRDRFNSSHVTVNKYLQELENK